MRRCYKCGAKMETDYIVCPDCEKKIEANRHTIDRYNYICGKIDELKAIRAEIEDFKEELFHLPKATQGYAAVCYCLDIIDKHTKGDPECQEKKR